MKAIIELVWFMVAVLPVLIFLEAKAMFIKTMNEKNWWWKLPYFSLLSLVILLVVLLLIGYR